MYKFIDLFCGIGGFRVALEKCGLQCVFSSDIDVHVQDVYYENFGEKPAGDIKQISECNIPKHDVLCAGFPCQSFSISGKMGGMTDHRGMLFYEIIRIAQYHQPLIILLENVKNILTIDNGDILTNIEKELLNIGYVLNYHVLNASFFGVPQKRERVYFVAIRKDVANKIRYTAPQQTMEEIFLENIIDKTVDPKLYINRNDIFFNKMFIAKNALKPLKLGIVNKGGQGERIYSCKGHAITLSAYGGGIGAKTGLYKTNNGIRRLSINESKKIMGFSEMHVVSDGMRGYQQLGNAVIPVMIENVWKNIRIL